MVFEVCHYVTLKGKWNLSSPLVDIPTSMLFSFGCWTENIECSLVKQLFSSETTKRSKYFLKYLVWNYDTIIGQILNGDLKTEPIRKSIIIIDLISLAY